MTYFEEFKNIEHEDGLLAGPYTNVRLENVSVSGGASRGMILGSDSAGIYSAVTAKADASKPLVIASENYADTDTAIQPVYTSGNFHIDKLVLDEGLDIADFKESLRRDNIILTARLE